MYSLLIVDDEIAIINGLLAMISPDEFGLAMIDTARDGVEALQMLDWQRYDLVITDVKMPRMNGLDLLEEMRDRGLEMPVILLTAYDQFDFAIRALRLRAFNYLMKPLNPVELIESLKAAVAGLSARRDAAPVDGQDKSIERNFITRWLSGDMDHSEFTMRASALNIDIFLPAYNVVVIRNVAEEPRHREMLDVAEEALGQAFRCWRGKAQNGAHVFIVGGRQAWDTDIAALLEPVMARYAGSLLWLCAVGAGARNYREVGAMHRAALDAFDNDRAAFLCRPCPATGCRGRRGEPPDYEKMFRGGDEREAMRELFHWIGQLEERLGGDAASIGARAFDLMVELLCLLERQGCASPDSLEEFEKTTALQWRAADDRAAIERWARALVLEGRRRLLERSCEISPVVQRTISIIRENYHQTLSLKQLGERLSIHPNYLGYLFKQETGSFFSDYLNGVRVEEAKRRLITTNAPITSIASDVGYANIRHFDYAFKRLTGMPPTQYRLNAREESM